LETGELISSSLLISWLIDSFSFIATPYLRPSMTVPAVTVNGLTGTPQGESAVASSARLKESSEGGSAGDIAFRDSLHG